MRRVVAVFVVAATAAAGVSDVPRPALAQPGGFADVAEGAFYAAAVSTLAGSGVFAGTECDEGFCPDEPIDRTTMAVWVVRIQDGTDPAPVTESRFADVDPADWGAGFIERMAELGVTAGCGDGTNFCPDGNVSRAQMAAFISRAYNLPDGPDPGFTDVAADAWYGASVAKLAASQITAGCGDGTGFCPDQDTTRAQMATFLYRAENPDGTEETGQSSDSAVRMSPDMDGGGVIAAGSRWCAFRTSGTLSCWDITGSPAANTPSGKFTGVSVGHSHSCAIRSDRTITCWGRDDDGQADAPSGQFTAVSAGGDHSCGLRVDKTITCWGSSYNYSGHTYYGQAAAPAGQFTAVSAGSYHSCGLRVDKTVTCWGSNYNPWGETRYGQANAPSGQFISVSAGTLFSCAVRTDGAIACWGAIGTDSGRPLELPSGQFTAVSSTSSGGGHACAVRVDGTIACWGQNYLGQADAPSGEYAAVSAGSEFSCAIRTDGSIICWGEVNAPLSDTLWAHSQQPRWFHADGTQSGLTIRIDSPLPPVVAGDFDVAITFSEAVADFETDDIRVVNGRATNVSGAGRRYRATIEPAADGTVVVRVPGWMAHGPGGVPNRPSPPLTRTAVLSVRPAQVGPVRGIDTWDRSAVVRAHGGEFGRAEPDWGYTGRVEDCIAGTTSQAFRDRVLERVNWYRRMAGLGTVSEDRSLTGTAQQKALIMLAQGALSHFPPPHWACYREIDIIGLGENLGLGNAGTGGVDSYIRDAGGNNLAVGHRLQILSPFVTRIGTGNVRDSNSRHRVANAMHLAYNWDSVPAVRELRGFVAWPPPGFVPARTVWSRWSFSTVRTRPLLSGPDFSQARVAVSGDDGPVPTTIIHRDEALVWAVGDDDGGRGRGVSVHVDADNCYTVTISGVRIDGAVETPYEYAVCLLHPADLG